MGDKVLYREEKENTLNHASYSRRSLKEAKNKSPTHVEPSCTNPPQNPGNLKHCSYYYGVSVNGFHPQWNALPNVPVSLSILISKNQGNKTETLEKGRTEQNRVENIEELVKKMRQNAGWKLAVEKKFQNLTTRDDYVEHVMPSTSNKIIQPPLHLQQDNEIYYCGAKKDLCTDSMCVFRSSTMTTASSKQPNTSGKKRKAPSGNDINYFPFGRNNAITAESSVVSGEHKFTGTTFPLLDKSHSSTFVSRARNCRECSTEPTPLNSHEAENKIRASKTNERNDNKIMLESSSSDDSDSSTSSNCTLEIDYKDVFLSSNVPQFIAAFSGSVVAWNNAFLKVTGLTRDEAKLFTIFSIVRMDKLNIMFEFASTAHSSSPGAFSDTPCDVSNNQDESSSLFRPRWATSSPHDKSDYWTVTLPCIPFPSKRSIGPSDIPKQYYITITLMNDDNIGKRCFHCVLTDRLTSNEDLVSMNSENLDQLYKVQPSLVPLSSLGEELERERKHHNIRVARNPVPK